MQQSQLEREIEQLADLPRAELVRRWHSLFGDSPPKGVQRGLLELGVAWKLQGKELGSHSPSVKRQLKKLIREREAAWAQARGPYSTVKSVVGEGDAYGLQDPGARTFSRSPSLSPGTRLVREWHGRNHHVDVIEEGFVFEGKTYDSLSAIAREITGARWSGPRFFGLRSRDSGVSS